MKVIDTDIEGVFILEPQRFADERGWFAESFSRRGDAVGLFAAEFVQENETYSRRGVVRGLHYQLPPHAQSKLVRVPWGRVLDVAVDIRRGSPTFGKHVAVELSGENGRQLFVPRGFAHGYAVLSDEALFQYKCDGFYAPQSERGIRFDDPQLGVDWRVEPRETILSGRDQSLPLMADAELFDASEKLY